MHIARFTQERSDDNTDTRSGVLTLTHITAIPRTYSRTSRIDVVDRWQMWNLGSGGFHIRNAEGLVVSASGYGMHDTCWGWLINKAVEIEELNN